MIHRKLASVARALVFGLLAAAAVGQPAAEAAAQNGERSFWRSVRQPGFARASHLTQQGVFLLRQASPSTEQRQPGAHEKAALIEGAIERFALAHRLVPSEPEFLFWYGLAASQWERPRIDGPPEHMDDETVTLLRELRELDPEFEAESVAFTLGIVHTRREHFTEAAAEYQRAIAHALSPDTTHWANLAEVTMLAGDLENAVRYYEHAIDLVGPEASRAPEATALGYFGLAVALDRLGEHGRAIEVVTDALQMSAMSMSPLHRPGVFFVPAYEIYWYEGLSHIALAADAESANGRRAELREAAISFSRFLSRGGRASPWADLAQRHVEELSAQLRGEGPGGRLAR